MSADRTPLQGLRVLVTRPREQADKWNRRLWTAGAETLSLPLLEICPITTDDGPAYAAIQQRMTQLDHCQHAIFVSQNAARLGLEWLDRYWPQPPPGLQCYAVGSATGQRLSEGGYPVVAAGGTMNSEALLARPELQDLSQQTVVIFRGAGGRTLLAEALRARGAQVVYCELYRRRFPGQHSAEPLLRTLLAQHWGQPGDLVAVHSGETLLNWERLLTAAERPHWRQLPLLLPGERVERQAAELGFTARLVALNASDEEMLAALTRWRQVTSPR